MPVVSKQVLHPGTMPLRRKFVLSSGLGLIPQSYSSFQNPFPMPISISEKEIIMAGGSWTPCEKRNGVDGGKGKRQLTEEGIELFAKRAMIHGFRTINHLSHTSFQLFFDTSVILLFIQHISIFHLFLFISFCYIILLIASYISLLLLFFILCVCTLQPMSIKPFSYIHQKRREWNKNQQIRFVDNNLLFVFAWVKGWYYPTQKHMVALLKCQVRSL